MAVEFVHPVIVGKRALPALALTAEGGPWSSSSTLVAEPGDIVMGFDPERLEQARSLGCLTLSFDPPVDDPFVHQELGRDRLPPAVGAGARVLRARVGAHDTGASSFLYPFLGESETDTGSVLADVRDSVLMKAAEIGELRAQTLDEGREAGRRRRRAPRATGPRRPAAAGSPPNPPLPDACSLRFHPACGNQTSTRMSESLDGVSFSVTRQKAGSVLNTAAALALVGFGGVKAPAGMDSADSTRPFVTLSCASDSHAIGAVAAPRNAPSVTAASSAIPAAILMREV